MACTSKYVIAALCVVGIQAIAQQQHEVVGQKLDSVAAAHGFGLSTVSILADTLLRKYVDERKVADPAAIIYVQSYQPEPKQVRVGGSVLSLKPPKSSENFSFFVPADTSLLITRARNSQPQGWWESVAQPVIVTLGAVAIIALFFLVRS